MSRRGISTFIATLLLMVLAVSGGVVIYAYTMGYLGGFGSTQALGAMSLDSASCDSSKLTAYIRNIGKSAIQINAVYVDGKKVDTFTMSPPTLPEGQVAEVIITYSFAEVKTYEVKLISKDNTQISFSVKPK